MTRPAQVVIDLAALRHNYSRVRNLAPNSRIISVVKADAYGNGLARVAGTLVDSDAFGVASIDEAMELRDAGITTPVVLFEGPYDAAELAEIERQGFEVVIHHAVQVDMLEQFRSKRPTRVWIKIDSGMHRLGFDTHEVESVWKRLQACGNVDPDMAFMTHLADASDMQSGVTGQQVEIFNHACGKLPGARSLANSAGVIAWPETHADYVRPGLMLYGISPIVGSVAADHDLRPVMTFQSRLISVKSVAEGESVGYGGDWRCPETMPVGIVAAGYADGYPRHGGSGTPIMINGTQCQVIGNPSMDMIAVDLRNQPDARVGDPVEIWGKHVPVEKIAERAGTIPYELVAGIHKRLGVVIRE